MARTVLAGPEGNVRLATVRLDLEIGYVLAIAKGFARGPDQITSGIEDNWAGVTDITSARREEVEAICAGFVPGEEVEAWSSQVGRFEPGPWPQPVEAPVVEEIGL